jgi:hypothetical protein
MTWLRKWHAGDDLSYGWVNKVSDWINGLKVTGANGVTVRQVDNQIQIGCVPLANVQWYQTINDPMCAPNYPTQGVVPVANVYYAQLLTLNSTVNTSGNQTLSFTTTSTKNYIINSACMSLAQASTGVGYVPIGTIVPCLPTDSGQLEFEYFGDEILFGQVQVTSGAAQQATTITINGVNYQQQNMLNVTDGGGGDAWVLQNNSTTAWVWDEDNATSDPLNCVHAFTPAAGNVTPTITMVVATVMKQASVANDVQDQNVQLLLNGNSVGPNKATNAFWSTTATPAQYVWMVPADQAVAVTDVNNINFGFQFTAQSQQLGTATLMPVQLTVFFTPLTALVQANYFMAANQWVTCVNRVADDYGPQLHQGTLMSNIVPGTSGVVNIADGLEDTPQIGNVNLTDPSSLGGLIGQSVSVYYQDTTGIWILLSPTCPC